MPRIEDFNEFPGAETCFILSESKRFAMQESQEATPQHEVLPEAMDGELWVIPAVLGIGFIWVCFLCWLEV